MSTKIINEDLASLIQRLGYEFQNIMLLGQALTHRSAGPVNNERLEFLGDGALNFIVADELYRRKVSSSEGELSRIRATLVRREALAAIAIELGLSAHLTLGMGESKSGGHKRDSILADSVEAILGAVYLDGGFDSCRTVICHLYANRLSNLPEAEQLKDPKTHLQEYLQGRQLALPSYRLIEKTGKAHEQHFLVCCAIDKPPISVSAGGSGRRRAEQAAARLMLDKLGIIK